MWTQASNSPILHPTSHNLTDIKIPISSHHDQLDKQRHTYAPSGQDLYETVLPWWRATVRARILSLVERESQILARMQARLVYHLTSQFIS